MPVGRGMLKVGTGKLGAMSCQYLSRWLKLFVLGIHTARLLLLGHPVGQGNGSADESKSNE